MVTKLIGGVINAPSNAKDAFNNLLNCYERCKQVEQREKTNREAIRADRDVELARIKAQKDLLEKYLTETFGERRAMLNKMFQALDKGLEMGNLDLINNSLGSILTIAKDSPLAQAKQLLADVKNPDVKSIEW